MNISVTRIYFILIITWSLATMWAMAMATRVAGDREGESDRGNSNGGGDEGE